MAKSVTDVAIMFGVLEGRAADPNDAATRACTPPATSDYTVFLRADGLRNARIGIPRAFFFDRTPIPGGGPRGGLNSEQAATMTDAIAVLRRQGAVVVDPANIPSVLDPDPASNFVLWNPCSGEGEGYGKDANCSSVLKYGMKRDFNLWLASLGAAAPVRTLTQLREWNNAHRNAGTLKYGQSNLDISDEADLVRDKAKYEADRARDLRVTATHGIDEVMKAERLDALLFPGPAGASLAARPGYPTVIVPFGRVANAPTPPFPAGFDAKPTPFGVSFTGMACSEPKLLAIAYAFEQATKRRIPPPEFP
jgi:amidase